MLDESTQRFPQINAAFHRAFEPGKLTLGLVTPLEAHGDSPTPTLERHIQRAQLADDLGYYSLWLRDVPFNVPSFGDAGQTFDPFVYLGLLSGATERIGLGVASIILPLRHPAHVAKSAASVDVLSGGRLLLGVASGDRPEEYPAMNMEFESRGARFRDSVTYIRAMAEDYPQVQTHQGTLTGEIDMLPKPVAGRIPLLITGGSRQDPNWVAQNGDGWITYPRNPAKQGHVVSEYRARIDALGLPPKPVIQSLYVDVQPDANTDPSPIHLGFASGTVFLRQYLREVRASGINHVALNLRFNHADVEDTMKRIADDLLPEFSP
ncbi:MAG: LLM class oxidoreductase [Pseudomonadota bacterium]